MLGSIFKMLVAVVALTACWSPVAKAWDDHEFDVFDTVEEVGRNFYEWLEIPQDASASAVIKLR